MTQMPTTFGTKVFEYKYANVNHSLVLFRALYHLQDILGLNSWIIRIVFIIWHCLIFDLKDQVIKPRLKSIMLCLQSGRGMLYMQSGRGSPGRPVKSKKENQHTLAMFARKQNTSSVHIEFAWAYITTCHNWYRWISYRFSYDLHPQFLFLAWLNSQ